MSETPNWRAFVLGGPDAAVAVEWLHVYGEVHGVLEEADAFVVWMPSEMPQLPAVMRVTCEERVVRPEDYTVTGLEHDVAIHVPVDLVVRPPWVDRPEGFSGVELVVPRGGAFGSGEHDSTKAALKVLHRGWSSPDSVADVGTGSGILALYASVRGCQRIEGCDIDQPSIVAARELLPEATFYVGGAELMAPSDLVVANMTGAELTGSLSAILSIWTRKSSLVLSGMRVEEVASLVAAVPGARADSESLGDFTAVRFESE